MRSKVFVVVLCFLSFTSAAFAQQQLLAHDLLRPNPGITDRTPLALHRQVAEVAVHLAVTDVNGNPVPELHANDLQVLDSGIPVAITALHPENELPLRVALVIDWSDSMQKHLQFEREVALEFLRNVLRPETDEAMVIGFRYRVEVTQPLTGNLQSLEAGLRPVGGVSLGCVYDALVAAADGLRNRNPYADERRVILLLSDGEDYVSAHGLLEVIQAVQRGNVTIYTINPPGRRSKSPGQGALMELARATGGRVFFGSRRVEQLNFAMIKRDVQTAYTLYFRPSTAAGNGLRSLEITAKHKDLQVQAPHSYYAGWE